MLAGGGRRRLGHTRSPENYLGYQRTDNFVAPNGSILETSYAYAAPTRVGPQPLGPVGRLDGQARGHRAQPGRWADPLPLPRPRPAPGHGTAGARDARFRVGLDAQPQGAAHGTDLDDQGNGTLTQPRLYQLIRQPGPVTQRTFEITFLDPGVQAYAFTFG